MGRCHVRDPIPTLALPLKGREAFSSFVTRHFSLATSLPVTPSLVTFTPSGVKIRHPPQHLLINHALRHPAVGQVAASAEHACGDGVDALVSETDVMRCEDDVVELQERIAG